MEALTKYLIAEIKKNESGIRDGSLQNRIEFLMIKLKKTHDRQWKQEYLKLMTKIFKADFVGKQKCWRKNRMDARASRIGIWNRKDNTMEKLNEGKVWKINPKSENEAR